MSSKINRLISCQRGAAAMEFALVAPFLLLIVFATIDYGWYLTQCIVANNAVYDAARAGVRARQWEAADHEVEDPLQFARSTLMDSLWIDRDVPQECVFIQILEADAVHGRRIEVAINQLPYRPITGYLGAGLLPRTLSARAVMAFP